MIAVDRHHVAWADQVEHQLELLLVTMAGGVNRRLAGGDDAASDLEEAVDGLPHRSLVAGDRRGRENDSVAVAQLDRRVVVVCHSPERRQWLPLGASGDDDQLVVRPVLHLVRRHQQAFGNLDVTERAADVDVLSHRASDERHLARQRGGGVDDLLDAMDVRRKAGHDDPPIGVGEHLLELRADLALRGRKARPVGIRGVAAKKQNP